MTLMCLDRSQSPTHKGAFLQGRKSPENNNIHHNNANNRRNSCSPPLLSKSQPDALKSADHHQSSRKLERSASEPATEKQRGVQSSNSSRYKTELCRPFEENGTCKYGDKCQFAHGIKELRSMARHPKYKTELCRTFHSTGLCPYGPRCHFIHNSEQSKKNLLTHLTGPPAAVTRPKALTSLGSAGDVSPPSSHEGSPTGVKTFEFQQQQQNSHSPIQFSADFVKQVSMLSSTMNQLNDFSVRDYCASDFVDSPVSVFNDLSPPDFVDNYSFHVNSLYPIPLTPSPAENNIFRHPLFDRY